MKVLCFLIATFLCSLTLADGQSHPGIYQVVDQDDNLVDFFSKLEFSGPSLIEANEVIVTFPTTLVGETNKILLKKIDGEWVGNTELFDFLRCGSTASYDFSCLMVFNPDKVQVIESADPTFFNLSMQPFVGLNQVQSFATESFNPAGVLNINSQKTKLALVAAGFSGDEFEHRLRVAKQFLSEPIGWIRYRNSGLY